MDIAIKLLLVLCVLGFIYGMFNHKRFIAEHGQNGFTIHPNSKLSKNALEAKTRMFFGYGVFVITILIVLILTAIFGPVKA